LRILVADDDSVTRKLLERHLKQWGHEVVGCADGAEAWEALQQTDAPRLAILDWMMPVMNGVDVCAKVRDLDVQPYVYIILLTSKSAREDILEGLESGADDYIVKPFDPNELRVRIRSGQRIVELQADLIAANERQESTNVELVREIHERKLAEETIRRSEEKYRLLVENAPVGIMSVDREGRIIEFNPRVLEILQFPSSEAAKSVNVLTSPILSESGVSDVFQRCMDEIAVKSAEIPYQGQLGENSYLRMIVTPIRDADHRVYGCQAVVEDFTDRKRAEAILLQSQRSKAVTELAGVVAHSFNNLLQIVIGGAQLALTNLELGNLADIETAVKNILQSSREGAETVRRLHYLSRAPTDETAARDEIFNLSVAVNHAIEMSTPWWRTQPEQQGIRVVMNRNLGPDCFVRGSDDELFVVALSLIRHAAAALPEGGRINVVTLKENEEVILEVRDNGVEIPKEDLAKVFSPYWTTNGIQATGTELDWSYRTVKRHQGEITVESEEGEGTTFTVTLPYAHAPAMAAGPPSPDALGPDLRILVVDDTEAVLRMLRDGLEQAGQKVFAALSGRKALDVFRTSRIDVVICDLAMPEMNGWDVAKAVRDLCAEKDLPKTPFILLTGWGGQRGQETKMKDLGVDLFVEKPIDISRLLQHARELYQRENT